MSRREGIQGLKLVIHHGGVNLLKLMEQPIDHDDSIILLWALIVRGQVLIQIFSIITFMIVTDIEA